MTTVIFDNEIRYAILNMYNISEELEIANLLKAYELKLITRIELIDLLKNSPNKPTWVDTWVKKHITSTQTKED